MNHSPQSTKIKPKFQTTISNKTPFLVSCVVLVLSIVTAIIEPPILVTLRNTVFDAYQRLKPRAYQPVQSNPVHIIDIDDQTLEKFGQWPWPRPLIADLLNRLQALGASAIAFDMVFAEPDRSSPNRALAPWKDRPEIAALMQNLPDHDQILAETIAKSRVVTGFFAMNAPIDKDKNDSNSFHPVAPGTPWRIIKSEIINKDSSSATTEACPRNYNPARDLNSNDVIYDTAIVNVPVIDQSAVGIGNVSFRSDNDGIIRRIPLFIKIADNIYPSLALEALRVAFKRNIRNPKSEPYNIRVKGCRESSTSSSSGFMSVQVGQFEIPTDSRGYVQLYYSKTMPERTIPAWKILNNQIPDKNFLNSILFIGTSAEGMKDLRFNPFRVMFPGVEVHAQLAEQVLQKSGLAPYDKETSMGIVIIFMVIIWICLGILLYIQGAIYAAITSFLSIAVIFGFSWYQFSVHRVLFDPLFPSVSVIAILLSWSIPKQLIAEQKQQWLRSAFSSYVSPNLVQHLIEHPDRLSLGGEIRECSFVMTDLAGFTSLMEKFGPDQVVLLLNTYLTEMISIAFQFEGTLDRIVGDAVAVMFSAPVTQPDHAERAVACALAMDRFARDFSEQRKKEGIPFGVTRIGVHTGQVLVGNFGGDIIFDYRALGDPINTASRLESVNKHLGTLICVSGYTVAQCPNFFGRPIGTLVLKGKTEGIDAFEPLLPDRANSTEISQYRQGFAHLEKGDAEQAALLFTPLTNDPLAQLHLKRIAAGDRSIKIVMKDK
ncbi:adenylate cyclase [Azospirillaceae bacterium]